MGRARESVLFMRVAAHGNGAATTPPGVGKRRGEERLHIQASLYLEDV